MPEPITCPSCGGMNLSCPDGCGRDPNTGELNGTTYTRPANAPGSELVDLPREVWSTAALSGSAHQYDIDPPQAADRLSALEAALVEAKGALEEWQHQCCETLGGEDMEPGCCRGCRTRTALTNLEAVTNG